MTGDGISDLLSRSGSGDLVVFPGTGSGGFGAATTYLSSGLLDYSVLGDVDGDGLLDVVSLYQDPITHVYLVAVMRGLGAGAFGAPIVTPSLSLPADLSLVDLHLTDVTEDGKLDVVAATTYGAIVLTGYGDGYFRQHALFYPFVMGRFFVISDHNNDGHSDIAFGPAMGIAIAFDTGCTP